MCLNHQCAEELMKFQGYEFMIGVRRWYLLERVSEVALKFLCLVCFPNLNCKAPHSTIVGAQ